MAFALFHELNIKKRLIILVLTGIIAMLLITGMTRYMDHYKTKSILLERRSQNIASLFQKIINLENVYILSMNPAILTDHEALSTSIEQLIRETLKTSDSETAGIAKSIMASYQEHSRIFKAVVANATALEQSKNNLIESLSKTNDLLNSIISDIDQEEAMLMIDGEFISSLKVSSRKETVAFKAFGNERMLNLFQNLLLYGDEKTYNTQKKALDEKIALAQNNIVNVYKAASSESLMKTWDKASLLLQSIASIQTDIFNQWKANQALRQNLNKTTDEVNGFTRDITTITNASMIKSSRWSSIISVMVTGLSVIILLLLGAITYRAVAHPIAEAVTMIKDIAEGEGDLTKRLSIKSKDEIGEMARWFNMFIEKLQTIIADISQKSAILDMSSETLADLSGKMTTEIGTISHNAATVSSSANDMSDSMSSLAAASEEYATNINMLAAAAEEMSATIQEIASNTEKAHTVSDDAVSKAKTALSTIMELGSAAAEINKVTEAITDISEQTNLLALNATIEAARAGEAGKGFAVVANEIKELARQTADATRGIKIIVEDIQNATSGTVTEIELIAGVVGNINDIVTTIASSVEEQTATTREIANNVSQASSGIMEVNTGVSKSSKSSQEIAADISEVNRSANELSENSVLVDTRSSELAELSAALKDLVGKFII